MVVATVTVVVAPVVGVDIIEVDDVDDAATAAFGMACWSASVLLKKSAALLLTFPHSRFAWSRT